MRKMVRYAPKDNIPAFLFIRFSSFRLNVLISLTHLGTGPTCPVKYKTRVRYDVFSHGLCRDSHNLTDLLFSFSTTFSSCLCFLLYGLYATNFTHLSDSRLFSVSRVNQPE